MSLLVRRTDGGTDNWAAVGDERSWFDFTHAVDDGELVVYQHTFRRVRMTADAKTDRLAWKHHTTKVARLYRPDEWKRVSRVKRQTPPTTWETVPRVPRWR